MNTASAKLILIHDTAESAQYPLKPGTNKIGRATDNDLIVDDPSVSEYHCEILLTPNEILVRDLGSLNGTWIDSVQIQDARLANNQTLHVGQVQFSLQTLPSVFPNRPASSTQLFCERCNLWLDPETATQRRVGPQILTFCPHCGARCASKSAPAKTSTPTTASTFSHGAIDAFSYPFRRDGWAMLLSGTIALTVTYYARWLASFAFILGLVALIILTIGVTGYVFAFIKDVIRSSSQGDQCLPGWPDVTSPGDFTSSFFQFLCLILFCFGPFLLWTFSGQQFAHPWFAWLLLAFGAFYLPMALVGVAMADSISGLNPIVVVPSILRIPGHYLTAVILLCLLLGFQLAGEWLGSAIPIPVLPTILLEFTTFYLLIVTARILGVMFFINEKRLAWGRP